MSEPLGSRTFRASVLILLLAASLFVTMPALKGDVLSYDDQALLLGSGGGGGALNATAGELLTGKFYYAYLPVYGLSLWLDGKLGASIEKPGLFRFQNLLWHAATGYVIFLILGLLLANRWAAMLGALLFVVHPVHVESVAWIAERKDVVSGFFFFLAWFFAILSERRRGFAAAALLSFFVACFAKASAVVLPAFLLAAVLLLPRYRGRRVEAAVGTWPYFAVAIVPVIIHLKVGMDVGVVAESRAFTDRLFAFVAGWGGGIQRTLLPINLSIDYPESRASGLGVLVWPGVLLLGAVAAVFALRKRSPLAAFGIGAFLVALLPFNNVFPSTEVLAADRYLYISLFGFAFLAAWAVTRFRHATAAIAVLAGIFFALSIASAGRFKSDEALWTATIEARDGSALAYINRGLTRSTRALGANPPNRKLLAEAVRDLEAGLQRAHLKEHRAQASLGLVLPLYQLGRSDEALERGADAIKIVEGQTTADARRFRADAHYHRGVIYKLGFGSHAAAAQEFAKSADLWSRYNAWFETGRAYLRAGRVDEGRQALERAASIERDRPEPHLDLANLHAQLDDRDAQHRALTEAARRAPGSPEVAVAWVDFWLGGKAPNYEKAEAELARLPETSPERKRLAAAVEAERALFLFRRREMDSALAAADKAIELGLDAPRTLYELGQIYLDARRFDDAIRCYRDAGDVFEQRSVHRDAVARAYFLKADSLLREGALIDARDAVRAALDARPELIEAGAAPLRREIEALREAKHQDIGLLAVAVVGGDPALARKLSDDLLAAELSEDDRVLVYRLRAMLRAFVSFDFQGAEEDLQQVLARRDGDPWARFRLAQAWMRSGVAWVRTAALARSDERRAEGEALLEKSIALLGDLIENDPEFHLARLARGEARFAQGDLSGAKADYLALRERGARMKEIFQKEAVLHRLVYVQGGDVANLESATSLLERALRIDPNYFDALYELGNVYHNRYDRQHDPSLQRKLAFNRALFWYRRAMALNPRVKEPRLEWARILLKAAREGLAGNNVKGAHDIVTRVEEEASDVAETHKQRVRVNMRPDFVRETGLGPDVAFDGAKAALERVEELSPGDPELPELRALYHRSRGYSFYLTWAKLPRKTHAKRKERARELAIEEFKLAFAAWPGDPENATVRDRLREIAPDVILIDQDQAKRAFEAGTKAFLEKRWPEAAAAFHRALALFPESVDLRHSYGQALLRSGRLEEAMEEFRLVANHKDGDRHPDALYELGNYYLARDQGLIARPWYERYVKLMVKLDRGDDPLVALARRRLAKLVDE